MTDSKISEPSNSIQHGNPISQIFPSSRVVLVHDWLNGFRGGERVFREIAKVFPRAPIYTLFHQKGSIPGDIEAHGIHTSCLNSLPMTRTHYRHYLPLFPLAAETLLDRDFDLVVSTSHAVAKSIRTRGAFHWCYIHSPMRYVWDRFDDYFGPERVHPMVSKYFFGPICRLLQMYDLATVRRVGSFVANSEFVRSRVQRFYKVDCSVIHPPADIERFEMLSRNPQDFYLFFSALVPYKKADHAIMACQNLKKKLVVLGRGPELAKLKNLADPHYVSFVENPSDGEIDQMYSRARGLLFPGIEDFGIVPVEANAAGLPVIGLQVGGLLDSQTENTCEFYLEQSVNALQEAIEKFEKRSFDEAAIRIRASDFRRSIFLEKINRHMLEHIHLPK